MTATLLILLTLLTGGASCSSDNPTGNTPPKPQPTSYDIYAAGYRTVGSKAVATVWKNGEELYTLTDGTANGWARALCVDGETVYTVGYEERQGAIAACLWENGTLKYTLGTAGGNSYAYAVAASDGNLHAAGSTTVDGALTAVVWLNGTIRYTYSVSPATSQARTLLVTDTELYAAGNLRTGGTEPVAQIWKDADAFGTLTDGTAPGDVRDLYLDGRTLYAAGSTGESAVVWRNGTLLYTLTDGSTSAEAMSLWMSGSTLYTAGYVTTASMTEQGIIWQDGAQLCTLSNGTGSGSLPYSVAAWGDDIFTAGTRFANGRHATIWKGSEILYPLDRGEAYALFVVPHYE